jgi:hypothetical protein
VPRALRRFLVPAEVENQVGLRHVE